MGIAASSARPTPDYPPREAPSRQCPAPPDCSFAPLLTDTPAAPGRCTLCACRSSGWAGLRIRSGAPQHGPATTGLRTAPGCRGLPLPDMRLHARAARHGRGLLLLPALRRMRTRLVATRAPRGIGATALSADHLRHRDGRSRSRTIESAHQGIRCLGTLACTAGWHCSRRC